MCDDGSELAVPCEKGKFSPAGSAQCTTCPAGYYQSSTAQTCYQCPVGSYCSGSGVRVLCTSKQICEAGTTEPADCPAHAQTVRPPSDTLNSDLAFCPPGYFAITDVFLKSTPSSSDGTDGGEEGGGVFEGFVCERLDAIEGLQRDARGSQEAGCNDTVPAFPSGEVPLFLGRDFAMGSPTYMVWQ